MKQYLMMCDESGKAYLERVLGGVQFLEVQGLTAAEGKYNLLISPLEQPKEIPPAPPIEEKQDEK